MSDRDDLLRVDVTGTVHPLGRVASQQLRARSGEWRLCPSPREVILLRQEGANAPVLKLAGQIGSPGALSDVVALIAQSNWTGELVVIEEHGQRHLFFDAGNLVGANTSIADERLGETLWRFGVITREQLDAAIEMSNETGKRLGEAAIELAYVTAEELYPMMARQVEEVFYAALHVAEGMFYLFDRFDDKSLTRRYTLNAGGLLMEGARRMDEMRFFRERIPNEDYIPVPITKDKQPPNELLEVWHEVDGKQSIAEIGRRIGQLEFEVTRAVFQLIRGGFVQMVAPRPRGAEAIVEAFNPALIAIHRACDEFGKGAELRDGLSRFATGGGVYDPLFHAAGPLADGSFRPDRVARNLVALAGDDPDAWLLQIFNEYVGFALFHAGSLLPRDTEPELVTRVTELMKPVRQTESPANRW